MQTLSWDTATFEVLGTMLLGVDADGALVLSTFVNGSEPDGTEPQAIAEAAAKELDAMAVRDAAAIAPVIAAYRSYLDGATTEPHVRLNPALITGFQSDVLTWLTKNVPAGKTTTYGTIADALGKPGSARAVGRALGANPLCVAIGCHRVLASNGAITGYAGGDEVKARLLELEAHPSGYESADLSH